MRDLEGVDLSPVRQAVPSDQQKERCIYLDRFVKDLWTPARKSAEEEELALIALGGYGEGLLCPGSDVDLLFLHRGLPEDLLSRWIENIIYPLWDYRFEVSYRIFTVKEALEFALEDLTFFTSLLSARFICGSEDLFQELQQGFEKLLLGREKEFYERLKSLRQARLEQLGEEVYFLEPHLKNSPGGWRDFQFFLWVGRIIFGFQSLSDFTQAGLLSPKEETQLMEASEFLRRVREELHIFCARKEDRLYMEYQPEIALRLGFGRNRAGTEAFMSRLFRSLMTIREAVEDLTEEVEGLFFPQSKEEKIPLEKPAPAQEFLLRIFSLQASEGRRFDRHLKRYLRGRRWSPEELRPLQEVFPDLLQAPHSLLVLRTLRDTGLLGALIPEFEALCGRIQYDVYHLYALDEHLFLTVKALDYWCRQKPELAEQVSSRRALYLAALLHDIAKGEAQHAEKGAQKARPILESFPLSEEEKEEVLFLIRQHLLLVDTALRRDLAEEKVIEEVALRVKNTKRLTALYLLTLADSKATGPKAFTSWKLALLEELYLKVERLLERQGASWQPEDIAQKRRLLKEEFPSSLVNRIPLAQLESYSPSELRQLLFLVSYFESQKPLFVSQEESSASMIRVWVITRDKPGLFAELAGTFGAAGFDVRKARAYTWSGGLAVDEFWLDPLTEEARLEIWKELFRKVLNGELSLPELVQKRRPTFWPSKPRNPLLGPPEVRIDQEASDFYSLFEIYAPDQPGLLFEIAYLITQEGYIIGKALLSEKEDLVADIFYLQTQEGEKLSAEEAEGLREKIQTKLKEVVS